MQDRRISILVERKEITYRDDCYEGVGLRYNGSINTTVNGNKCLPWDLYPDLLNNFCRNPQGYGKRPWCYIDYKKRIWEYCDIQICSSDTHQKKVF